MTSKIEDAVSFLELEEVDEDFVDALEERIQNYRESQDETATIAPDSKLDARNWLLAYAHYEDENDFLSEYKKKLEEKYIKPIKEKIEKNQDSMSVIKAGLSEFLDSSEESKVNFPDIGTVSRYNPPVKIVYPENESEFAERLLEENSEFIIIKPAIDKAKIKKYLKENNSLPIDDLSLEEQESTVRFTRSRKK